jgi:hypothetical protein
MRIRLVLRFSENSLEGIRFMKEWIEMSERNLVRVKLKNRRNAR